MPTLKFTNEIITAAQSVSISFLVIGQYRLRFRNGLIVGIGRFPFASSRTDFCYFGVTLLLSDLQLRYCCSGGVISAVGTERTALPSGCFRGPWMGATYTAHHPAPN
jgi:hypothetical protein